MHSDRQYVTALARGLDILACFDVRSPQLSNAEISKRTGLPHSSVSRLTHTLIKQGYLEYDEQEGIYRLGLKILLLQPCVLAGAGVSKLAEHYLEQVADELGERVVLSAYEDLSMVVVQGADGNRPVLTRVQIGVRYGLTGSATGRAYIASSGAHEQQRILHQLAQRDRGAAQDLNEELGIATAMYRKDGYCVSLNTSGAGMNNVATPAHLKSLGRRVVLTCGGPKSRVTSTLLHERIAPCLLRAARRLEQAFERPIN